MRYFRMEITSDIPRKIRLNMLKFVLGQGFLANRSKIPQFKCTPNKKRLLKSSTIHINVEIFFPNKPKGEMIGAHITSVVFVRVD